MKIEKVKGWSLNCQIPTGKMVDIEWNGIKFPTSERKYSFLYIANGLADGFNVVEVIATSEKGAWDKLRELLQ